MIILGKSRTNTFYSITFYCAKINPKRLKLMPINGIIGVSENERGAKAMLQQKINYHKMLTAEILRLKSQGVTPRLLLQCCCAPCSSYVLEYLDKSFDITPYFYNPNISPESEYDKRANELSRLVCEMPLNTVNAPIIEQYDNTEFEAAVKGLENEPEGGARCAVCYKLRLEKAAQYAKANGFDYFCTTLSISPLKNSQTLNQIGKAVSERYGVKYLFSDFKKNEGFKRSVILCTDYGLYRQNYCGCKYSKAQNAEKTT